MVVFPFCVTFSPSVPKFISIEQKDGVMKGHVSVALFLGIIAWTFNACTGLVETPGERFRKAIQDIEAACAKRKLAPNEVCGGVAKLKPADPLATEEGR